MLKFKNQDAYEARFRALQIVDERAAVKSVNGVLPDDAGAITLTPADINAVSVEDVANIRGAFRINVTYSGGVFSADKTFDEIKAAYDAGQQPYVVQTGGDAGVVYTFAVFTSQFVSFERYLIFGDTLKTVRLRIFPHTLENGSNIDRQTEAFDVASTGLPGAVRYDITQALSDTEKAQARANIGAGTSNFDGQYSSLTGQPTIPTKTSDLTNDSGFGTYSKPAGGIPKADLAEAVQTSLGKADTALQTHQSLTAYRTAAAQDVIDAGKQDKLIAGEGITIAADGKTISSSGKVSSVNGQTGDVVLDADAVGAQRPLIAGSGIAIIPSDNGDIIQSNALGSCGNGLVSFVNNGVSIAQFTLNQTQNCEIDVNDLTEHLHNKFVDLETSDNRLAASLSNNYRTAAAQDVIDNTKLTDAPTDGKAYARKNGSWSEVAVVDVGVESVNGKAGVVTLNATEIPSTKLVPTDTISFLIDGAFDESLVELTRNGASASANDFISAINSGATVTVSLHDQGNPKVTFDDRPVKYKITGDTLSLCFIAEKGHTYTPAIYVLSGTTSGTTVSTLVEHNFTDSFYQENYVSANDLPVQAPLTVEEYLEELESSIATLQTKSITDTGGYFHTDTVEGALQEIGAELAGINTLLGSGIQISFTIDGDPFSAVSGETWKEWIGGYSRVISEISGLTLYCFSDDGIIFADEAGVNALGLNDVWVHGNETIVSGATYAIIPCGG